jgi:hypothetical protein
MPPAKSSGSRNRWPLLSIPLRVFELQCAFLVWRDHRDPSMHRPHDLAPCLGVEPVGELVQPLVQSAPELNACGNRWRRLDRAQARDMLVADPAVLPVGFDQAHCQPVGRLAKVHEHCSGTIPARFLPSEARPLFTALASSWRMALHSITSSARAMSIGGMVRSSALAAIIRHSCTTKLPISNTVFTRLLCWASHERASALRPETAHCRSLISHNRPAVFVSCASGLGGLCSWSKKYTPLTFATSGEVASHTRVLRPSPGCVTPA